MRTEELFRIIAIKFVCSVADLVLKFVMERAEEMLQMRTRRAYNARIVKAVSRLDVPTASDPIVQSKLTQLGGSAFTSGTSAQFNSETAAVDVLSHSTSIVSNVVSLASQAGVLYAVLRSQRDGAALAATTAGQYLFSLLYSHSFFSVAGTSMSCPMLSGKPC